MLSVFSIPYRRALFLSKSMDVRELRRNNLLLLKSQQETLRAIADLVDTDPNYFSQILSPKSKAFMGHALARRIERALGKPEGWMDQDHTPPSELELDLKEIEQLARRLSPDTRTAVKAFMRSMVGLSHSSLPPHPHAR